MPEDSSEVRARGFADFSAIPPEVIEGHRHWLMQGQNFWLEWVELANGGGSGFSVQSDDELLLISAHGALRVVADRGDKAAVDVPAHSVCILAPAGYRISGDTTAKCMVFASRRSDLAGRRVLNAESYDQPDSRIAPTGRPFRRRNPLRWMQVIDIATLMASKDKPRLKMLQTETLSINIVEYTGPRNRAELSPHSHSAFEQGSLAIAGSFVHHLRVPWGGNADQWREDEHLPAPSPSLLVVPVGMIHTTEGVEQGHHFLVDLFSPPRADFICNGWVANSDDYTPSDTER